MRKQDVYFEQDGIRVDGCANKTEASKAWEAKRAEFAKRAAECGVWTFCWDGCVVIVEATPHGWAYTTISDVGRPGVRRSSCFYDAPNQVGAIAVGLGSLAQAAWHHGIADDATWFDAMVSEARLRPGEVAHQRENFLHVTPFWREHPIPQAAA